MNVLLFNPDFDKTKQTYSRIKGMPLGILSIATYLNRHSHNAVIVDRFFDHRDLNIVFETNKPDIVGIALIGNVTIFDLINIGRFFRERNIPVAIGGPHASVIPELILNSECADYVIIGEGEETWLSLVESVQTGRDINEVKGIAYKGPDNSVIFTEERDFMDLSLLGSTDFSLISDIERYFSTAYCYDKMLYLYYSKGCTGNCTFCFNEYFHRCRRRVRPVADVLDEIEYLIKNHGLKTVYFSDELWGLTKSERDSFFNGIEERRISFIWGCQTRIGVLKYEDIQEMYNHGCRWIMFGVEAPPGRLAELANKKLRYDLLPGTLDACNSIGVITNISFIINYPHQTEQDLKDTVTYALSLNPTYYSIHYYYPVEKSALYYLVTKENLFCPPKTLQEAAESLRTEEIVSSFSEVKNVDYRVVRSCFLLKALATKSPGESKDSSFFFEAVKSVFIDEEGQGFKEWLSGIFNSGKYFVSTVSTVLFHPKIRKKYGISLTRFIINKS